MHREKEVTPMLVFAIFAAVLGMFQFGYNTGVTNAPQRILEEFIANIYKNRTGDWISEELRDIIWSSTVSIFAVGGMIGGLMAPSLANWCGRKTGMLLNNTIAILGIILMSVSQSIQSIECLIVGRFFIGLNCGLSTALVPMYLTEIATVNLRRALGTVSQLGVTIGLFLSQILGLKEILGTEEYWPLLFSFAFIPAILQFVMLLFCPESPRYLLLSCGRVKDARKALRRLRNTTDIEFDMEEMRAEQRAQEEEFRQYGKLTSIRELINHRWLRAPLIVGVMMQLSQQLSGINAIFYYSTDIFLLTGVPKDYAVYATMGVGFVMVIMTLVSVTLMDKLGRRSLHLLSLGGMFLASIFLTISLLVTFLYEWTMYISVLSILLYALFFAIGPGLLPWMITAELFTQGTRSAAMNLSVLVSWFTNFIVGLTFPLMKRVLQSSLFLPFTVLLGIFWVSTIFIYKKLPETKNRTFEEIAALFRPIPMGTPDLLHAAYQNNVHAITTTNMNTANNQLATTNAAAAGAQILSNSSNNNTPSVLNSNNNHQHIIVGDRFRFDAISIGDMNDAGLQQQQQTLASNNNNNNNNNIHQHNQQATTICSNSINCGCLDDNYHFCPRGSLHSHSINFNHIQHHNNNHYHNYSNQTLPHASCTSIPQNLSTTSDQQPLIVDTQSDKCLHHPHPLPAPIDHNNNNHHHHHHHHHHLNQHSFGQQQQASVHNVIANQHHHDHLHHHQSQSDLNNNNTASQCCLRTTSFMATNQSGPPNINHHVNSACTCCEQDFFVTAKQLNEKQQSITTPPINYAQDYIIRGISKGRISGDGLASLGAIYSASSKQQQQQQLHLAGEKEEEQEEQLQQQQQARSRTLTRVYKPLNDIQHHQSAGSTNNLSDNLSTFQATIIKKQIK